MGKYIGLLVLLIGCGPTIGLNPEQARPNTIVDHKKLVLVGANSWGKTIEAYAAYKTAVGYDVQVLYIDNITTGTHPSQFGTELSSALMELKPDYVFLIGDVSIIPTIYACSDISSWSTWSDEACIYSDYMLTLAGNNDPSSVFALGRLMASTEGEFSNYFDKVQVYDQAFPNFSGAYVISDRVYDPTDNILGFIMDTLGTINVNATAGVIEANAAAPNNDAEANATYSTLQDAFNSGVSFVQYYGHGGAQQLGYYRNDALQNNGLSLSNAIPIPLVFAMACQTAFQAPNVPYYIYYDDNGNKIDYTRWNATINGPITKAMIGNVATIQKTDVLTDNIARHITSAGHDGAMVYIGETVITSNDSVFLTNFMLALVNAYNSGNETIGDVWLATTRNHDGTSASQDVHPEYFQFVGDPTTAFPKKLTK
jgi:hypothetical protein